MLGAFNEETPDWLSFFMFTFFTDRDGKMQLESLAQSGFDPLSRTCRFMLTEEAHHMFVGETGVGRIDPAHLRGDEGRPASRTPTRSTRCARSASSTCRPSRRSSTCTTRCRSTCSARRSRPTRPTPSTPASRAAIQRPRSRTTTSSTSATYPVCKLVDGEIKLVDEPALTAINMRLRDDYTRDCAEGVERWNKIIEKAGVNFQLELPHDAFNRKIGEFAGSRCVARRRAARRTRMGRQARDWLPSKADGDFIAVADEAVPSRANSPAGSRRRKSASTTSPAISNM